MSYRLLERLRETTKRVLYATPLVTQLVRRVRARRLEHAYLQVAATYAVRPAPPSSAHLLAERGGERLERFRRSGARPHVLFVGTLADQDDQGLLDGLRRVAGVTVFTQRDGRYGQTAPEGRLSFDLAVPNGERLLDLLDLAERRSEPVDLVLGQMWSGYLDPSALDRARREHGALVVNIGMDDRHTFAVSKLGRELGTRALSSAVDCVATAAPEAVEWFRHEGCAALFFPEASDPDLFRPMPELGKPHDVVFVGEGYGVRRRVVERLAESGVDVVTHGSGWPNGRLAASEVPAAFAQAKVVLGVGTIGQSASLVALKLRDFDGPMSGSCYVTTANPDLDLVYDIGREIVTYADIDDCARVVRELLADDERRHRIAAAGRERAVRDHSWERRFGELFAFLRGEGAVLSRRDGRDN